MEQGQNRKKIVLGLFIAAIIAAVGWFWQASNGALFSPTPSVSDTIATVPEAEIPATPELTVDVPENTAVVVPDKSLPDAPAVTTEVAVETVPAPEPELATVEEQVAAPLADEPEPIKGTPTFDVVRVEDDGSALIAGQTPVGGKLFLRVDGNRVEATAKAVRKGEQFVIFTTLVLSDKPQVLELEVATADHGDIVSDQQIFVAPRVPQVASIAAAPAVEDTPAVEDEPAEPFVPKPQKPTVLVADADGDVRVLASPVAVVALDTIRYDLEGDVALGGRAAGDGFVRVYLDNKPITTSKIEGSGFWATSLPDVDTGVYTLRVDELDEDGSVTSRVETPFQRESPSVLQAFAEPGSAYDVKAMTVQPGTTLWAMAVAKYGDGSQFMKVFEANKETIRDPNLIFPGQIFDLPD